jgi:hypothetical protein
MAEETEQLRTTPLPVFHFHLAFFLNITYESLSEEMRWKKYPFGSEARRTNIEKL